MIVALVVLAALAVLAAGIFGGIVVRDRCAVKNQRKSGAFSERYVVAQGRRIRVSVASWGMVFMATADAIMLAGDAVRPTSKKMVPVGRVERGRVSGEVLMFSAWFAQFAGIDFLLLWQGSDLAGAREVEIQSLVDSIASSPDEGETVTEEGPDTLEEELVKALRFEPQGGSAIDKLTSRTPAQRLRDGE